LRRQYQALVRQGGADLAIAEQFAAPERESPSRRMDAAKRAK
jgi:hypothetical protein